LKFEAAGQNIIGLLDFLGVHVTNRSVTSWLLCLLLDESLAKHISVENTFDLSYFGIYG